MPTPHISLRGITRRFTHAGTGEFAPDWSPDGQRIAFESNRDGTFQIWTVSLDGSDLRQLTRGSAENTQPVWSKDSTRISFVSKRDGREEIYVMSATDGANQSATGTATDAADNSASTTVSGITNPCLPRSMMSCGR